MPSPPILVIFDIDETLIQYLDKQSYNKHYQTLNPEVKDDFLSKLAVTDIKHERLIIFRPHLKEFFDYVRQSRNKIKVALWTYSEHEYAVDIKNEIVKKYDNALHDDFIFTWGVEDMFEDDDFPPKDLSLVWNDKKRHALQDIYLEDGRDGNVYGNIFNKFNTFLVDDRFKNLTHKNNMQNSIYIQPFAPFGTSKGREPLNESNYKKATNDTMFLDLINILNNIVNDVKGCSKEDIDLAFSSESIFDPNLCSRKNINTYLRGYGPCTDWKIKLLTIGDVHLETAGKSKHKNTFYKKSKRRTRTRTRTKTRTRTRTKPKTRTRTKTKTKTRTQN